VPLQVRQDRAIRLDDLMNEFRAGHRLLRFAGLASARGNQQLDIELVRIRHQPNHRLLIVGIGAHVRQHRQPRTLRRGGNGHPRHERGKADDPNREPHPSCHSIRTANDTGFSLGSVGVGAHSTDSRLSQKQQEKGRRGLLDSPLLPFSCYFRGGCRCDYLPPTIVITVTDTGRRQP
jgi:hypothetical protein